MAGTKGYPGSDAPPDDKPFRPGGLWERLTTVFKSVSWQLLYANNNVVGYRLLLSLQGDSLPRQSFVWGPVVVTVIVGWLSGSYWNPGAAMFKQLDEQSFNQQHEPQIITLMDNTGGSNYSWATLWDYSQPLHTPSGTVGSSCFSLFNNDDDDDRSGWPTHSGHTYGVNCYEHPCCTQQGNCIFAPNPIKTHSMDCACNECLDSLDEMLATFINTECNSISDNSFLCTTDIYPQASTQEPNPNLVSYPAEGRTVARKADSTTNNPYFPPNNDLYFQPTQDLNFQPTQDPYFPPTQNSYCPPLAQNSYCPQLAQDPYCLPPTQDTYCPPTQGLTSSSIQELTTLSTKNEASSSIQELTTLSTKNEDSSSTQELTSLSTKEEAYSLIQELTALLTKNEASSSTKNEASSSTKNEASSSTKNQASSSTQDQASSSTQDQASSSTQDLTSKPTKKRKISGQTHPASEHSVGVEECGIDGCRRRFTITSALLSHKAKKHGLKTEICGINGCILRFVSSDLATHQAQEHGQGGDKQGD